MRHSLLARLLLASLLVVVCSITATAWLATITATGGIQRQQGQAFASDAVVYQGLLDYAVTNQSWDAVGPVVRELSQRTGLRVILTDQDDRPIADSGSGPAPPGPAVTVDPLALDLDLVSTGVRGDAIDPRVVGPFALTVAEERQLEADARQVQECVDRLGGRGAIAVAPNGRPSVDSAPAQLAARCGASALNARSTASETTALKTLQAAVNTCLAALQLPSVSVNLDLSWSGNATPAPAPEHSPRTGSDASPDQDPLGVQSCLTSSRRQLLASYVPSPALLRAVTPAGQAPLTIRLSPSNVLRIVWVVGAILVVACGVTVLAGIRIVRPLQALTHAAHRAAAGDTSARVPARGQDEVARLAGAFNMMAAARERLEVSRKAMVSDIAHELRSPLTTIRGWLETTQDGLAERSEQRDQLLLDETLHLQRVVSDLQDLAVSDAGGLRLNPERLTVGPLLAQVLAAHTTAAAARGVRLDVAPAPDLPLRADPERLRQILDNLVSNALRHTPREGTVTVRCHDGDGVRIEVADTGCGISAQDLPHVFDRFWRADPSRHRETGGSGLGLAIARSLADAHGGTLSASSTPGRGSVFTLWLPG